MFYFLLNIFKYSVDENIFSQSGSLQNVLHKFTLKEAFFKIHNIVSHQHQGICYFLYQISTILTPNTTYHFDVGLKAERPKFKSLLSLEAHWETMGQPSKYFSV